MKLNININERSKFWATIIYCDNIELLDSAIKSMHIRCALSPLHNNDMYDNIPDYYESDVSNNLIFKKPHYHLLMHFENAVSRISVKYLLDHKYFNYAGIERVMSFNGYARYLCHLDNPEKYKYDINEILYYRLDNSILDSPKKDNIDKSSDIMFFVDIINKYGIEDTISLYNCISKLYPDKLGLMIKHIATLERFTRGMYQCSLRQERLRSASITTTK